MGPNVSQAEGSLAAVASLVDLATILPERTPESATPVPWSQVKADLGL